MPAATRVCRWSCRAGLAALLGTLCLTLALDSNAGASKSQWSMFEDARHLASADVVTRQRTLDEIKGLGADTLRISIGWAHVAPDAQSKNKPQFDDTDPLAYPGFRPFDDTIARAQAMGFRIMVTLGPDAPRWATGGGRGGNYKIDADRFAAFATAVGRRYSGNTEGLPKVDYFSIWNEPNHSFFLKPRAQAPRIYRQMVEKGVPALRGAAAGGTQVFVGELAPVGTDTKVIGPLGFMRKWMCLDDRYRRLKGKKARSAGCKRFKRIQTEGFAHHPYGLQAPGTSPPKSRDIVNISVIRRLGQALDKAARAGRIPRRLPIYSTEFGFQSSPPDPFVGITLARQAQYLNEAEELSYRYSRLRSFSQYLLYDDPPRSGSAAVKWSGFQTGLKFANGVQKPSMDAWRLPIVVHKRGSGVRIWGKVRPGSGSRTVQLQRKSGGSYVNEGSQIRTNSLGYFNITKSRRASYRFVGYVSSSDGALEQVGTSRVAKPVR